jgi:hypothetical protein
MRTWIHWLLGGLLLLVALNAFGGGWYGIAGAEGVPIEWLDGSPFDSYLVPSVILFTVVGGTFLTAALGVLGRKRWSLVAVVVAIVVAIGWLTTQLAIIGYVSWLQPVTAAATLAVAFLAALMSSSSRGRVPRER